MSPDGKGNILPTGLASDTKPCKKQMSRSQSLLFLIFLGLVLGQSTTGPTSGYPSPSPPPSPSPAPSPSPPPKYVALSFSNVNCQNDNTVILNSTCIQGKGKIFDSGNGQWFQFVAERTGLYGGMPAILFSQQTRCNTGATLALYFEGGTGCYQTQSLQLVYNGKPVRSAYVQLQNGDDDVDSNIGDGSRRVHLVEY
jgi:hypothetical protein